MTHISRKECLYNKALATTLEGSPKILQGTSARSGCDETGRLTEFWDILENIEGGILRTGSGVITTGSYFRKLMLRGLGSYFKYRFGLPGPKKYRKSKLGSCWDNPTIFEVSPMHCLVLCLGNVCLVDMPALDPGLG